MSRAFEFTIQNGIGDEATVTLRVRDDRHPNSYIGFAIANAARRLPENRPFKCIAMNEIAPNAKGSI